MVGDGGVVAVGVVVVVLDEPPPQLIKKSETPKSNSKFLIKSPYLILFSGWVTTLELQKYEA